MATLLRKMTRKSKVGFGKKANLTIQFLLTNRNIYYLRWMYYGNSGITFFDDILDEIGVTEEYRILKPGKDLGVLAELENLNPTKRKIHKSQRQVNMENAYRHLRESIRCSKGANMRRNRRG